jgi:hypothetical protein
VDIFEHKDEKQEPFEAAYEAATRTAYQAESWYGSLVDPLSIWNTEEAIGPGEWALLWWAQRLYEVCKPFRAQLVSLHPDGVMGWDGVSACAADAAGAFASRVWQEVRRRRGDKSLGQVFQEIPFDKVPPRQPGWLKSLVEAEFQRLKTMLDSFSYDEDDEKILRFLNKYPHRRQTQDHIFSQFIISRRTLGTKLRDLLEAGLIRQPKGRNNGVTIAPKGQQLLDQIDRANISL